ncbi:VCBS repeat-containing protein [Flexithrix dorotheae]|uniref:VCBS repeat-containing protein n=1 Tax=Flexithrix dorotheae TaxID=70993 RepID=UPI00146CEC1C|nr:VCBS repeat-containing protein [Flexithrix dorotheae]
MHDPEEVGVHFINALSPNDSFNIIDFRYFYNGGGAAIGDLNNDGYSDIVFSGNMVPSQLYLNRTAKTQKLNFENITHLSNLQTNKWCTGVSLVDINQDGLLDIYFSVSGNSKKRDRANLLFINQGINKEGIPTFQEKAAAFGLDDTGYTNQAAFFDYDKDGDLDVYLLNAANSDFYGHDIRQQVDDGTGITTDKLLRNEGINGQNIVFREVSNSAGITKEGFGLGLNVSDINADGWPDIFVSNDYISNDLLYLNKGDSNGVHQGFLECSKNYLLHQSHFSMGNDIADMNNDGLLDIITLDMLPEHSEGKKMMAGSMNYERFQKTLNSGYTPQYMRNMLFVNRGEDEFGNPLFSELGQFSGIHQTDWSWGPLLADFDNDGFKDLFITNGYSKDITNFDFVTYSMNDIGKIFNSAEREKEIAKIYAELPQLKRANYYYKNTGNNHFNNHTGKSFPKLPSLSNGAAYGDLDNDGDLDLIVNNIDEPAFIFENQIINNQVNTGANFLRLKLTGPNGNLHSIGAKVILKTAEGQQIVEKQIVRGYQSTMEDYIHFGLKDDSIVSEIEIIWPDRENLVTRLSNVTVNRVLEIKFEEAAKIKYNKKQTRKPDQLFYPSKEIENLNYRHQENHFVDFKNQPLLPHKLSRKGPGIAVGDIDQNGLEDFFVGGAYGENAVFFLQTSNGNFNKRELNTSAYEDLGVLFFDLDNDQDLDLYIVSGGTHLPPGDDAYQDRIYMNDGYGNFELDASRLPEIKNNGSCIIAADYDGDNDLDLFVGGNALPFSYPFADRSFILENVDGKFQDVTEKIAPGLQSIGIVSDAIWTDYDQDQKMDLLVVGEWMPITFFHNDGNHFKQENPIPNSSGWWNSIATGDFDEDGDMDYLLGNLGLNSQFDCNPEKPVTLFTKDFDENGTVDPILSCFQWNAKNTQLNFPYHNRDELAIQIASLKKRFPNHENFSKATIDRVFTKSELKDAYTLQAKTFVSSLMVNEGNGKFHFQSLPEEVQYAPVYGMLAEDFDHDGHLDVVLTGNSYSPDVKTGRYDASLGTFLKGNGKGNFEVLPFQKSGFLVKGEGKGMAKLMGSNGPLLVVTQNSDELKTFRFKNKSTKLMPLSAHDAWAEIKLKDGRSVVKEFYYGSTYLSQSSRSLEIEDSFDEIIFHTYKGESRKIKFPLKKELAFNP